MIFAYFCIFGMELLQKKHISGFIPRDVQNALLRLAVFFQPHFLHLSSIKVSSLLFWPSQGSDQRLWQKGRAKRPRPQGSQDLRRRAKLRGCLGLHDVGRGDVRPRCGRVLAARDLSLWSEWIVKQLAKRGCFQGICLKLLVDFDDF